MAFKVTRTGTCALHNRKKSGEIFVNFVDIRGLTIATNRTGSEELWFLIGIHADVTDLADTEITREHMTEAFRSVRQRIGTRLKTIISESNADVQVAPNERPWSLNVKWKPRNPRDRFASLPVSETQNTITQTAAFVDADDAVKYEDVHKATSNLRGGIILATCAVLISGLLWRRPFRA